MKTITKQSKITVPKIHSAPSLKGPLGLAALLLAFTLTLQTAQGERRYRVYKSDPFGFPEDTLSPSAVLEIDKRTGRGAIYEADLLGEPNTFEGPKYIIEPEKRSFVDHLGGIDDELCGEIDDDDDVHTDHRHRPRSRALRGLFDD